MKARLNIPLSLCNHVAENKYFTEFSAYLALQLNSSGILDYQTTMQVMSTLPKLTSQKSRVKHFQRLLSFGWIGYNVVTGNVFLRSIKKICEVNSLCTKRVSLLQNKDLPTIKQFVYGALLCNKVRQQDVAIRLNLRKKPAVKYRDAALQVSYTGLGKYGLARLFSCSLTEAVRIKTTLEQTGYIETKERFEKLKALDHPDFFLRKMIAAQDAREGKKLFFRRFKSGQLWLCRQLHDQISSRMVIRTKGLWFGTRSGSKVA